MPLLFILLGIALYIYCEISLLVSLGSHIGLFPVILLMLALSVSGLWLIKQRGLFTVNAIRQQLAEGKIPTLALLHSLSFIVAGMLLIIPGLISDLLALLLLIPSTRQFIENRLINYFKTRVTFARFSTHSDNVNRSTTFDAEFERKDDDKPRLP